MKGIALIVVVALMAPAPAAGQAAKPRTAPAGADAVVEASRALAAGDLDRALRLAGQHLQANPASVPARLVMARAHMAREEHEAAYDHLRRAQRSSPRNVDVLYYIGIAAGRLAEMELHRLAEIAPDSARLHQVRAESLALQQRPHEAAAAYEAALAGEPDLIDALLGLAKLRRTTLRCAEAIELYKRAEALRPTFQGAYGLGVCLQNEQHDQLAAEQFQNATQRDPGDALAWQGLGLAEMKLGRLTRAVAHLQHAIKLQPDMYEAYYTLGQIYRAAGDLEKAKEAFTAAQQLQRQTRERGGATEPPPAQPPR